MGNLLTTNQATFEGTPHLWGAFSATLALSTAQFAEGAQSLSATSTSTTEAMQINSGVASSGSGMIPVTVGSTYSALVEARAATVAKPIDLRLQWFSGASAPYTFLSEAFSSSPSDTTTGWTQASVSQAAPATATVAMVAVIFDTLASGAVHYLDKAGLMTGSTTTWEAPFSGPVAGDLIIARS